MNDRQIYGMSKPRAACDRAERLQTRSTCSIAWQSTRVSLAESASTASYVSSCKGARSQLRRVHEDKGLLQPLLSVPEDHDTEQAQASAADPHWHACSADLLHRSTGSFASVCMSSTGSAGNIRRSLQGERQAVTSPFSEHQAPAPPAAHNQPPAGSPHHRAQTRWQDATKKVSQKAGIRFGANSVSEAPVAMRDDTANANSTLGRAVLQPRPSGLSRFSSNLKLPNLSKSFSDNKAQASAFAEVVRAAQQQQQTNRQNAAPVLKAVPSTKVHHLSIAVFPDC